MAANQPITGKAERGKSFALKFPRIGNLADPKNLWFQWTFPQTKKQKVSFNLKVYRLRPGQTLSQALKGRPVYAVEKLTTPHHQYPEKAQALDPELPYCWRVEARDGANRLIGRSLIQGFRFRPPRSYFAIDRARGTPLFSDRSVFLPIPPFLWGCPVRLRPASSLPEEEPPPDPGEAGTVDPLAFTLWGSEAARVYLIPSLVNHARIRWDYSYIPGCRQVLLQTAGADGFAIPNATDARADTGVRAWYLGPVTVSPEDCDDPSSYLLFLGASEIHTWDLNLQKSASELLTLWSDYLYIRLASLDADGNQIEPASDHVSVHCVEYPAIELESCEVEWLWGESPRRRIHFTIGLRREFPSTLIHGIVDDAPATIIIGGMSSEEDAESTARVIENVSLTEEDGTEVTILGTWRNLPSYFKVIDGWLCESRYSFTLEQSISSFSSFLYTTTTILLQFTELRFLVECIPGLRPTWTICRGRMLDGDRPPTGSQEGDPCARPLLHATWDESGLEPIYRLFTQPLAGRRVSSRDGEQDVQVRFEFPVVIANFQDFKNFLRRNIWVDFTLVETIVGSSQTYDFRLEGFHARMWRTDTREFYGGDSSIYPGRLVYDPPRLEMYFQCDRSYWFEAESRYVEDIETVDYYLSNEE